MDIKCNAGVVKSETLSQCPNTGLIPEGISGPLVSKIPVVIAEPVIQIDVEAEIDLEDTALEIKRIKKNVFITQCKLITTEYNSGKLFISGYVRKNIEYATPECVNYKKKSVSGYIKHTTVNVPFRCVTKVNFINSPQICYQKDAKEASFLSIKNNKRCDDLFLGSDSCEQNFEHHECFNEQIFCELEEAKIFENDTHKGIKYFDNYYKTEQTFDSITEKMVVFLRIKLLQLQQVGIPSEATGKKETCLRRSYL